MLHPLIDSIDLDVSGPEQAYDWLLPSLPRWSPRAHLQPRTDVALHVGFGPPPAAGQSVLQLPLVEISRDAEGRMLVTAPRVGATVDGRDVELCYEPSASPRCVQAVFDAIWPLVLPSLGLFHLHAAALRDDDHRGWLLVGPTGSGKSTATLALASAGWHFAADDTVYATGVGDGIVAHGWAAPLRVTARTAHAFGIERVAPFAEIEADAVLDVSLASRRIDCIDVHRLVFPELCCTTSLDPIPPGEALRRLAATTPWVGCLPAQARRYVDQLGAIAAVPAAVLRLGPELLEEPERLAQHLEGAAAAAAA